ncbi:MAG TPA: hypothetical protein VGL48_16270 [Acidimicrobiales bacterium]
MVPSSNGDSSKPPKLSARLSETFLRPAKPRNEPPADPEPDRILSPSERKAAMGTINAVEAKWSKGGLILAGALAIFLPVYVSASHTTGKAANKTISSISVTNQALLLGGVVLLFCLLGFIALRRRRRTLLVFTFFIIGFAYTLVFPPLGFALILLGGWLMLRAYRIQKYGTANAKMAAREAATRPPRRERKAAAAAPPKPTGYKAPTSNKRYTPKAPTRKKIAKPSE